MPNQLSSVMPKILAQGLLALRQQAAITRTVNTDYDTEAKSQGDSINVPIPSAIAALDVAPGATPPATADVSPTSVAIPLNKWKEAPFYLTDKELGEIDRGNLQNMQVSEAAKSLINAIALDVYAEYKGVYGFVGTPGTTPFATTTQAATDLRKVLNNQLAPLGERRAILNPDAEANALGLSAFQYVNQGGTDSVMREGELGRRLGFDWHMDQLVPTHASTALSAGAATVNGAHAAGVKVVSIAKATNPSNLVVGDVISFAGDSQTYVVTAAVTLAVGNTNVAIEPALQTAKAGGEALTLRASHVVNLGFHRDAFALAIRPLKTPDGFTGGNLIMTAADPLTKIALRLEISREHKRTRYSFDVLYGTKLVRPELAARLAG